MDMLVVDCGLDTFSSLVLSSPWIKLNYKLIIDDVLITLVKLLLTFFVDGKTNPIISTLLNSVYPFSWNHKG